MRIGFLFHKNPLAPVAGADLVRLRALCLGLDRLGAATTIVAPVTRPGLLADRIPVLPLSVLAEKGRFDILKACYHFSLELLGPYDGPLVCRLVRVADEVAPARDAACRRRLLACQELAAARANGLIFNNVLNLRRWRERYGGRPSLLLPTGCPAELPPLGPSPYPPGRPVLVFLGSLAAPRMAGLLNRAAEELTHEAAVHFVGRNKTGLYGAFEALSPLATEHGEVEEDRVWDYLRHADLGLALAAGPDPFDNDLSKITAYLRAGLPVLGEQRLANASLFAAPGFGAEFRFGDATDLARKARRLLSVDFASRRSAAAQTAARRSWDRRAEVLLRFCRRLARARA